ncbi:MAG: methylenetetrahydrofolate reductase C-terminal domain-containing protein [Anaerolineales bacterium]|nr:methylenetetrahydrofolate reductase C-terminal domain-containing protein [Anaerolineales bacterium]
MIIGEQKPLDEIKEMIADHQKILVLGCGTCVTVCFAGGEKEVGILASALRMATALEGRPREFVEATVQRQCEYEYNEEVADLVREADAVLSLACGIGVQTMNEQFPEKITLPGLNTSFLGQPTEQGVWDERCQACGNCILDMTAGICPITRCSKSIFNGPCGGSVGGKCEIAPEVECAWQLIYDRLKALGKLEMLTEIQPAKDWSTSRDGGPRKIVREDLRQ